MKYYVTQTLDGGSVTNFFSFRDKLVLLSPKIEDADVFSTADEAREALSKRFYSPELKYITVVREERAVFLSEINNTKEDGQK